MAEQDQQTYTIKLAECGTPAAYRRHRRRGEECATCKAGWASHARDRRKNSKINNNTDRSI